MASGGFVDCRSCKVAKVVVVMNVLMVIVGLLMLCRFWWSSGHVVLMVIVGLCWSWSFCGHKNHDGR